MKKEGRDMRRWGATGITLISAAIVLAAAPAEAIVQGVASSLSRYTVRLIGNGNCSGVVVARRAVVTAAHCAEGMRVIAEGESFRVYQIAHDAVLDDGRTLHVSGDASVLLLKTALPASVQAAPVGDGGGNSFIIAGYGTTDEGSRDSFGELHEAQLVPAGNRALVDPNRNGSLGASACFGDSGGPVFRGGMLVGIITRAANPSPRVACGKITRWAPITIGVKRKAVASKD